MAHQKEFRFENYKLQKARILYDREGYRAI
jgi:hypothetical protein